MAKVLVGVPCMETLPVEFVQSITKLRGDFDLHFEPLSLVYVAREAIVDRAIRGKYDYVLFIDSDMIFTGSLLNDLLRAKKDINTGLAFMRKPPFSPCVYTSVKLGETPDEKQIEFLSDFDTPREVEGCGLACCLIRTEVFRKIREKDRLCFWPFFGYGEDLSFCLRARKAGFKINVDPRIRVGHIGKDIILEDQFRRWNDEH